MNYAYVHKQTAGSTGYFGCDPDPVLGVEEALRILEERPYDSFLRRYVLTCCSEIAEEGIYQALVACRKDGKLSFALQGLVQEILVFAPHMTTMLQPLLTDTSATLMSSLVFARKRHVEQVDQLAWARLFTENMQGHKRLVSYGDTGLSLLYPLPEALGAETEAPYYFFTTSLDSIHESMRRTELSAVPWERPPADETAQLAQERLLANGIIAGEEQRHTASLSPIGLLRPWNVRIQVDHGSATHRLVGRATTYGRGLHLAAARASCLMEMVERASCYVSIANGEVTKRATSMPLVHGSKESLCAQGKKLIDPTVFPIEGAYTDEELYWVAGHDAQGDCVWVPLQMAALFCNLDEVDLFDTLGSTGIATGTTMAEAKVAALTEVIERDAEATMPFSKESCFLLQTTSDPLLAQLLANYTTCGIQVQFQDLTGALGVPAYKCFVMGRRGEIYQGFGAHLTAQKAIVAAMTETPYPFPGGSASGPVLRHLPTRCFEDLPDYSLGHPEADLRQLESLFIHNGRMPVYVDFTHVSLQFPVVRALVPHMELSADKETFSYVPPRLFAHYLALSQRMHGA